MRISFSSGIRVEECRRKGLRGRVSASTLALLLAGQMLAGCGQAAATGSNSPRALTHLTLWLDYTPWGAHVPLFAAEKQGFFHQEGLDVSIKSPSSVTDPLKLVTVSANTLGIGYMSDVVTAESQGIPVVSIAALVQHHLNCIMTLKSSHITSPRQLAGKRIGAAETPADSVILDTVFKHAGVTGKVQRVNLNYDYVQALVSGRVDAVEGAYQVWERIIIEQLGHHVNVIQLQNWGVPDEYELVLLAGKSMISHQPGVLKRFMRAVSRGVTFAVRHPAAAVGDFLAENPDFLGSYPKTGRQLISRSWRLLIPFMLPADASFGTQSQARWQSLARWMYGNRLVTRSVQARRLFTNQFLST